MNSYDRIYSFLLLEIKKNLQGVDHAEHPRTHNQSHKDAFKRIKAQIDQGKPVTYRQEGGIGNKVLHRASRIYAKKKGVDFKTDTLEHPDADFDNKKSPLRKKLDSRHGKTTTQAGVASMHLGQGRPEDKETKKMTQSKSVRRKIKQVTGAKLKTKRPVSKNARRKMEVGNFPRGEAKGKKGNAFSKISDTINRDRRKGFEKNIASDAKAGRTTIGSVGRGHIENPDYIKRGTGTPY